MPIEIPFERSELSTKPPLYQKMRSYPSSIAYHSSIPSGYPVQVTIKFPAGWGCGHWTKNLERLKRQPAPFDSVAVFHFQGWSAISRSHGIFMESQMQTWNTTFCLHKQIWQILLYTALFEHFQCNMQEHCTILHKILKIYTSIACTLAHYPMSVFGTFPDVE